MRIEVKGRNLPVSEDLREHVAKRFQKVARQVSELAELEVELFEERNPAIADSQVAEATLHLKGVTLRARDASRDIVHSINLCSDELSRQVKRHRDKRRKRRESRAAAAGTPDVTPPAMGEAAASKRSMCLRHFDVQMVGGMVLHDGSIAEMKTGEGKTLTATLPVVLNSLGGRGVHLVTVNDYLARRDAMWMKPIYDLLGVTVGVLQNMQPYEEKRAAYAADVTYGTNSEFGFDYLRDNMATSLEEKVQHGGRPKPEAGQSPYHTYAIVDEVDNILIDEARTPLIISGAPEQAADLYVKFARLARQLEPGKTPEGLMPQERKSFVAEFDYEFDEKHKTVAITERGVAKAERFLGIDHLYRAENGHLVNHLIQSLKAESLLKRDVDYAVVERERKIV